MKNSEKYADVLIGLGASFVVMTSGIALVFMAFPLPEVNTYTGGLTGLLLIIFLIAGAVLFTSGLLLERGRKFRASRMRRRMPMAIAGGAPDKDEPEKEDTEKR
jgi:hypothetical protein